jgi:hypothetical protein
MNDKDKEAFEEWCKNYFGEDATIINVPSYFIHTWQAACEYKDKEIDFFKDRNETNISKATCINQVNDGLHILLKEAEAENKKLREALKLSLKTNLELWEMPDVVHLDDHGEAINLAIAALKEVEE